MQERPTQSSDYYPEDDGNTDVDNKKASPGSPGEKFLTKWIESSRDEEEKSTKKTKFMIWLRGFLFPRVVSKEDISKPDARPPQPEVSVNQKEEPELIQEIPKEQPKPQPETPKAPAEEESEELEQEQPPKAPEQQPDEQVEETSEGEAEKTDEPEEEPEPQESQESGNVGQAEEEPPIGFHREMAKHKLREEAKEAQPQKQNEAEKDEKYFDKKAEAKDNDARVVTGASGVDADVTTDSYDMHKLGDVIGQRTKQLQDSAKKQAVITKKTTNKVDSQYVRAIVAGFAFGVVALVILLLVAQDII